MAMAAAVLVHSKLALSSALPYPVLLLLCLLLSCSHRISCTCSGSQPYEAPSRNLTVSGALDQLPGYLFLTNMSNCRTNLQRVDCRGLGSYIKTNHPDFDLSQKGWFFVGQHVVLVQENYNRDKHYEASFSVAFTMSIYQPNNHQMNGGSLVFAMETLYNPFGFWAIFNPPNWQVLGPSSSSSSSPSSSTDSAGGHLTAEIGTAQDNSTSLHFGDIIWVQIGIEPQPAAGNSSVPNKYSAWIDYDHISHHMSVYADAAPKKPGNPIASKYLTIRGQSAVLGLFSSIGQLLQVHTWNSTVDELPDYFPDTGAVTQKSIILSSVLGSVAATAVTTAIVFMYLNSKYRRWKKEQDELAKIMQGIPGVPAHVDFTEIRKATRNFHETTKLGKGGFGAVYRCKLPPAVASSRSSRTAAMDVAVKKFTRQVEDHRCSDFIAEVSIINRLRHKNIVPLIGWSYNKGEARLGDFGIACTVAGNRSSVTGITGTWGYIAPDYAMSFKATRQTDIYAFGVLILEIVTGKKNGDMVVDIPPDDNDDKHVTVTDWIWRLHGEGKLLDAVDGGGDGDRQDDEVVADDARRLLLLGLSCTNPNPSDRPSMGQVLQVINKVMPPPDVPPEKPAFVWPPRDWRSRNSVYSTAGTGSDWNIPGDGSLASTVAEISMEQPWSTTVTGGGGHASVRSRST